MITTIKKDDASISLSASKELYQCKECGFHYEDRMQAEKCQAWCKEHKSCNLDIIKYAIEESENTSKK